MTALGSSKIDVSGLCLGGNVFGWTADEAASFAVLDEYLAGGGNFIDTADSYSYFAPGNKGGESETLIGKWASARGSREKVVIATKIAKWPGHQGLHPDNIASGIEGSLERLQTDHVDLYYAHEDDPSVPTEDWYGAFDALVKAGKVRALGLSNFTAERIEEVVEIGKREGFAPIAAIQPHYSLVERDEADLLDACVRLGLACVPYWALARGFLTGKYRHGGPAIDSPRAGHAVTYLDDPRAAAMLDALDEIATAHEVPVASVAVAWLREQRSVVAPIASARNHAQLAEVLPGATLELSDVELERLTSAW
jgi:aryl-alcohol dehydrogenase-like predicted oxidoreductase